jgi:hypothetical protein
MPHLQVASASNEGPVDQLKAAEAENDTVRAEADVLLALATTASKQVQGSEKKVKHTSRHPSEEQGHQAKTRDQCTPGYAPLPPVTPSPLLNNRGFEGYPPQTRGYEPPGWVGHAAHSPPAGYTGDGRGGQVLGVYGDGNRRLFASPIRRQNEGEGPPQEKSREGKPEENLSPVSYHPEAGRALQYRPDMTRSPYYGAPPNMMPPMYGYRYPPHMPQRPHGYDERYMHTHSPTRSPLKRNGAEDRSTQGSPKRQQLSKEKPVEVKVVNTKGFPTEEEKAAKQRVISPTSSLEGHSKTDEDDSSKQQDSPARAAEGLSVRYPPQSPYSGPPVMRSPFPPHPYYPGAPGGPIHAGYHGPPREAWRMTPPGAYSHGPPHGPPRGPPHGPPSYPHPYGHPQAGYPYPAPGMYPPHQQRQPIRNATDSPSAPAPRHHADDTQSSPIASRSPSTLRSPIKHEQPLAPTIKSVAEWQQATLATGMAPSANRCMALKAPIPSKYWGEAEKAKDTPVPDFHRLVNYPDYLTKARPAGMELSSHNGKRNCVMCGKLRVCSASTASLGGNVLRRSKGGKDCEDEVSVTKSVVEETDESTHIIPRQNKGLCTGCDVTVWVVAENKLEIKWCKGCKNFRPWASFGDKGSATKCVRCRDRQREKYAMQKDELRVKRTKVAEEKRDDGDHEMAAAKGLRDLMAMGATSL